MHVLWSTNTLYSSSVVLIDAHCTVTTHSCDTMSSRKDECSQQELQEVCTKSLKQYLRESVVMSSQESLETEHNDKGTDISNGRTKVSDTANEKTKLLRKQQPDEGSSSYRTRYFTEWQSPISDWKIFSGHRSRLACNFLLVSAKEIYPSVPGAKHFCMDCAKVAKVC